MNKRDADSHPDYKPHIHPMVSQRSIYSDEETTSLMDSSSPIQGFFNIPIAFKEAERDYMKLMEEGYKKRIRKSASQESHNGKFKASRGPFLCCFKPSFIWLTSVLSGILLMMFIVHCLNDSLVPRQKGLKQLDKDPHVIEFKKRLSHYTRLRQQSIPIHTDSTPSHTRIFMINRHFGVSNDLLFALQNINATIDEYDNNQLFAPITGLWSDELLSEYEADRSDVKMMADYVCDNYDWVIVADVNPDARFLLQRIVKDPTTCRLKKLIFVTTNRFDYHNVYVFGEFRLKKWHQLVRQATQLKMGPTITWIANNPYDIKYAEMKLGGPFIKYQLVRSFGYSSLPAQDVPSMAKDQVVISKNKFVGSFYDYFKTKYHMDLVPLGHDYGGPLTLAKYKALVEIPYQVSTMKLYENLANGVTLLIPSPTLFYQLYKHQMGPSGTNYWGFDIVDFTLDKMGHYWQDYVDYYHRDFKDLIYYFDSFDQLYDMLQHPIPHSEQNRIKSIQRYQTIRDESLEAWNRIFNQ